MYKIVRTYFNYNISPRTLETGLTLREARAHCKDPETSSRKATSEEAHAHTAQFGAWFDGYEEE